MERKYTKDVRNTQAVKLEEMFKFFHNEARWNLRGAPDGEWSMLWDWNAIGNGTAGKTIVGIKQRESSQQICYDTFCFSMRPHHESLNHLTLEDVWSGEGRLWGQGSIPFLPKVLQFFPFLRFLMKAQNITVS